MLGKILEKTSPIKEAAFGRLQKEGGLPSAARPSVKFLKGAWVSAYFLEFWNPRQKHIIPAHLNFGPEN